VIKMGNMARIAENLLALVIIFAFFLWIYSAISKRKITDIINSFFGDAK